MIDLTKNKKRDLNKLSVAFYEEVKSHLKVAIEENKMFLNDYLTSSRLPLGDYLEEHIEGIITNELNKTLGQHESELKKIFKENYVNKLHKGDKKKKPTVFKNVINKIFYYESQDKWKAYSFVGGFDIDTCPYCNRNYITTLGSDNDKFFRADIDHYLPKSKYPYLRLSFYNLVPSCEICNRRAKKDKSMSLSDSIYPYKEGFGEEAKFNYFPKNYKGLVGLGKPKIGFDFSGDAKKIKRIKKNIEVFRLEEQYSTQKLELNHLLQVKEAFPDSYIENLIKNYPDLNLTKEQAYYYLFGIHLREEEDENQPLSKFKRDILKNLDLI